MLAVLPRLTPTTALGLEALRSYAALAGVTEDEFRTRLGAPVTPESAGEVLRLASGELDETVAYALTGEGLIALTQSEGRAPAGRMTADVQRGGCEMRPTCPSPVVHLELHTADLAAAIVFCSSLLRWREEQIDTAFGCYHALELGGDLGGGIVACDTSRPLWLPHVDVDRVDQATDRAVMLGATVLLAPREGPAGWRSVVATPEGGEIAFWQQKR